MCVASHAFYLLSSYLLYISFVAESQCIPSLVPVRNKCNTLIGDGVVFAAWSKIANPLFACDVVTI